MNGDGALPPGPSPFAPTVAQVGITLACVITCFLIFADART